ncbi:MAG: N-acetylneuraminate synthase [Bacteriovoracaceae bacterium]|nr:N-acetylneuraminate synthase [Bacteriovoracaceae bacterium]
MSASVKLGNKTVGKGHPVYICGEIGINHNGDVDIAKKLIEFASVFDFDCVKFQKRNPDVCVPEHQKSVMRETPWGEMTYLDYKKKVEFEKPEYDDIKELCTGRDIHFTASVWDLDSLDFLVKNYDVPFIKIPSAFLTNYELIEKTAQTGVPLVLSSGMSTQQEIDDAINFAMSKTSQLILCHCHSAYPAPIEELNIKVIQTFTERYPEVVIGYSGHEFGLDTTVMAAAFGAHFIERHITLDRTMWGTDQIASVEPHGMYKLARDIRLIGGAVGDGVKKLCDSELVARKKLRGV